MLCSSCLKNFARIWDLSVSHWPHIITLRSLLFEDVEDVKFVINYDYPQSSEDYIHRIGRTGRQQQSGTSYAFFTVSNMRHASDLISVLRESNQEVSPQLIEMADLAKSEMYNAKNRKARALGTRGNVGGRGAKIPSSASRNGQPQRGAKIPRGGAPPRGSSFHRGVSVPKRGFAPRHDSFGQSGSYVSLNQNTRGVTSRGRGNYLQSTGNTNYQRNTNTNELYGQQGYSQGYNLVPPPPPPQMSYSTQGSTYNQFNSQVPPPGYNSMGGSQCVKYPMGY